MTADDFDALRETAVESRLWLAMTSAANALARGWAHSQFSRGWRAIARDLRTWSPVERVRWAAVAIASAALGHLALLSISPPYVAPGLPRAWVGIVAIAAGLVAFAPEAFEGAWRGSRLGRIVRRLAEEP